MAVVENRGRGGGSGVAPTSCLVSAVYVPDDGGDAVKAAKSWAMVLGSMSRGALMLALSVLAGGLREEKVLDVGEEGAARRRRERRLAAWRTWCREDLGRLGVVVLVEDGWEWVRMVTVGG